MGRIVHFEITAEDPERAAEFYRKVFNWEISKWDGPMDYWMIGTGPKDQLGINGGLMLREGAGPLESGPTNAFICTVDVEDLDATIGAVVQAGGHEISPKKGIPGQGWMAYCRDTEGNIFGLMQNDPAAA
jgi:predicted enzyme related to lactoylglutathione lyase